MRHWFQLQMTAGLTVGLCVFAGAARAQTKVACVGDSITAGAGATGGNDYPAVLGRLLGGGWQVRNFGDSGKTMMKMPSNPAGESYWLQPTYPASKAFAPAIVVIMLGTNDSKTANWRGGNNMYDADYRAMIGEFQALARKPNVFIVLPPPATMPSFTIDGAVIRDAIVPIIRKIAVDIPSVSLIDVFDAYLPMPDQYLTGDGVHPNDKGHALLAQTVFKALTAGANADGGSDEAAPGGDARGDTASDIRSDVSDAAASNDTATEVGPLPGTGGTAGTGGATGSGGTTGGSGGSAAEVGGATGGVGVSPSSDSGCSCRAAGDRPQRSSFATILTPALFALLAIRRRRLSKQSGGAALPRRLTLREALGRARGRGQQAPST